MKAKFMITILAVLLLVVSILPVQAEAQVLKRDLNGNTIQLPRTLTAIRDSIPSQGAAVYDSIAVPVNAVEATIIFTYQPGMIYTGSAKTLTAKAEDWVFIPKEQQIKLPVIDGISYIKYKSYTGANAINILWYRM